MSPRKSSRRDFFRTRPENEPVRQVNLLRVGRAAMATTFEIFFSSDKRAQIETAHRALDEVRRLESIMTIYRDDSELSRVNGTAAKAPVRLTSDLFEVLATGIEFCRRTEGAFDITSGPLSRCWGFYNREGQIPSDKAIEECLTKVGWRMVELDRLERTVSFTKAGLELNLGSIGKGFALDRAASMLQNAAFGAALLHAGHSSILAVGDAAQVGQGWKVSLRHPLRKGTDLMSLRLRSQAMGTSGIGEQSFKSDGEVFGHIIDPRSGRPASHSLMVAAVAPTAAEADALATAFSVMSTDSVEAYCETNDKIGAIVVPRTEESEEIEPLLFGIEPSCIDT